MNSRKVEATSEPKLLGKAEANWKIIGWTGPLSHVMRSRAECFVNIPSKDNSTEEIQLRFHLKPYHGHHEPKQKFCVKRQKFLTIYTKCDCNSCKDIPVQTTAGIPLEFLPKLSSRSAGYELLVDVLNGPDNVVLAVSINKLNGEDLYGLKNNLVIADADTGYVDLPVMENFWRVLKWTEGEGGKMENCITTLTDRVDDARFKIDVLAYEIKATGTDVPVVKDFLGEEEEEYLDDEDEPEKSDVEIPAPKNPILSTEEMLRNKLRERMAAYITSNKTQQTEKEQNRVTDNHTNAEEVSTPFEHLDVILKTEDGLGIHAKKSILTDKSKWFRQIFTGNISQEIAVPLQSEELLFLLQWMNTGKIDVKPESPRYFFVICVAAKKLEIDTEFWSWLGNNWEDFFTPDNVPLFMEFVHDYQLKMPTDLKKKIEFAQRKVTGPDGEEFDTSKWKLLFGNDGLLKDVKYTILETDSKKPETPAKTPEISTEQMVGSANTDLNPETGTTTVGSAQENVQRSNLLQHEPVPVSRNASPDSESNSDNSFQVLRKRTDSSADLDSESDNSLDSNYELVQTDRSGPSNAEEIEKMREEFAILREKFKRLTNVE